MGDLLSWMLFLPLLALLLSLYAQFRYCSRAYSLAMLHIPLDETRFRAVLSLFARGLTIQTCSAIIIPVTLFITGRFRSSSYFTDSSHNQWYMPAAWLLLVTGIQAILILTRNNLLLKDRSSRGTPNEQWREHVAILLTLYFFVCLSVALLVTYILLSPMFTPATPMQLGFGFWNPGFLLPAVILLIPRRDIFGR